MACRRAIGLVEDLGHRVVAAGLQHHPADGDVVSLDELVAGAGRDHRHPALEHEDAVLGQVAGGVGEAADLAVLGDHVADRVVHQVDQPVRAAGADAGHVAHPDLDVLAAGLLPQAVDHVPGT